MSRRVSLLLLIVTLMTTDSAQARRLLCRRAHLCRLCVPCKPCPPCYGIPCYCLSRKYLEYPGPYDLWECTTFPDGCDNPATAEDDLYYGFPSFGNDPPQYCGQNGDPGSCETEGRYGCHRKAFGSNDFPGHNQTLPNKAKAWKTIEEGLSAAGFSTGGMEHEYYKFPNPHMPEINHDVYVIVVIIPPADASGEYRYLGIEMESHGGALDPVTFTSAPHPGRGRQFSISYRAHSENRKLHVWMKK